MWVISEDSLSVRAVRSNRGLEVNFRCAFWVGDDRSRCFLCLFGDGSFSWCYWRGYFYLGWVFLFPVKITAVSIWGPGFDESKKSFIDCECDKSLSWSIRGGGPCFGVEIGSESVLQLEQFWSEGCSMSCVSGFANRVLFLFFGFYASCVKGDCFFRVDILTDWGP